MQADETGSASVAGESAQEDEFPGEELARLFQELAAGDATAATRELFTLCYEELRGVARRIVGPRPVSPSVQPTQILNDFFIRFQRWIERVPGQRQPPIKDRTHFFNVAARAMRQLLVEHARRKERRERAEPTLKAQLHLDALVSFEDSVHRVLDFEEALARVAEEDPLAAELITYKVFAPGPCRHEDLAEVFQVSKRTIDRRWKAAKALLRAYLSESRGPPPA